MKLIFKLTPIFLIAIWASVVFAGQGYWLSFPKKSQPAKKWMEKHDWHSKRGDPDHWTVEDGILKMVSDDDSVMIGTTRGFPLDAKSHRKLRFEAAIDRLPKGATIRAKSTDDAAFRIYIMFDKGGGWFTPPETLGYVWDNNTEPGSFVPSNHFDNVKRVVIGSGATVTGQFIKFERDIVDDYRHAFKRKKIPMIAGVGVKCDSNHTDDKAASRLKFISLSAK